MIIVSMIALYGVYKGYQELKEISKGSDAAKAAINAARTARTASRASRVRVRKIVEAGRERANQGPQFGKPFSETGGRAPGWSHKNPSDFDPHRIKKGHPLF